MTTVVNMLDLYNDVETVKATSNVISLGNINTNFSINANRITTANIIESCTLSFPTITTTGKRIICSFIFTLTNGKTLTLPNNIIWKDGRSPIISTLSNTYNSFEFITDDNGITWRGTWEAFGGIETLFVRPNLNSDGTLGGSSFAVWVSSTQSAQYGYMAVDGNTSNRWYSNFNNTGTLIFYNPVPLKVSRLIIYNHGGGGYSAYAPGSGTIYGSNDNVNWSPLLVWNNSTYGYSFNLDIPINAQAYYKYYKLDITTTVGGNIVIIEELGITATYIATS